MNGYLSHRQAEVWTSSRNVMESEVAMAELKENIPLLRFLTAARIEAAVCGRACPSVIVARRSHRSVDRDREYLQLCSGGNKKRSAPAEFVDDESLRLRMRPKSGIELPDPATAAGDGTTRKNGNGNRNSPPRCSSFRQVSGSSPGYRKQAIRRR